MVVKTLVLYAIMITGAIWEKEVFGKYLFADAFFWEDAVSMLVIALHTAYLAAMLSDWGTPHDRMVLALAAYATYAINASQFLLKLRAARLEAPAPQLRRGGAMMSPGDRPDSLLARLPCPGQSSSNAVNAKFFAD